MLSVDDIHDNRQHHQCHIRTSTMLCVDVIDVKYERHPCPYAQTSAMLFCREHSVVRCERNVSRPGKEVTSTLKPQCEIFKYVEPLALNITGIVFEDLATWTLTL